jgi:hypothetical protein
VFGGWRSTSRKSKSAHPLVPSNSVDPSSLMMCLFPFTGLILKERIWGSNWSRWLRHSTERVSVLLRLRIIPNYASSRIVTHAWSLSLWILHFREYDVIGGDPGNENILMTAGLDDEGIVENKTRRGLRGRFPDFGKTTQCSREMQMHRGEGGSHKCKMFALHCLVWLNSALILFPILLPFFPLIGTALWMLPPLIAKGT